MRSGTKEGVLGWREGWVVVVVVVVVVCGG
jgi:hypothetical protein